MSTSSEKQLCHIINQVNAWSKDIFCCLLLYKKLMSKINAVIVQYTHLAHTRWDSRSCLAEAGNRVAGVSSDSGLGI